jgi:DNA-binding NarL/FixJ family response regulator
LGINSKMEAPLINIILTDNNHIVREGLKSLLQRVEGFSIAGETRNTEGIFDLLQKGLTADVVLIESTTQKAGEDNLVITIKKKHPTIKVLILSDHDDQQYVAKAFKFGADGYLSKTINCEELIFAIRHISRNETYVSSNLMRHFVNKLNALPDVVPQKSISIPNFTNREIEILALISQGYTNTEISEMLFTSRRTIENHRQGLIDKTGSRNIVSLVRFAILSGLIS